MCVCVCVVCVCVCMDNQVSFPYLIVWVWDHGWLPLSICVIIPVLWLGGIGVSNVFGFVIILQGKREKEEERMEKEEEEMEERVEGEEKRVEEERVQEERVEGEEGEMEEGEETSSQLTSGFLSSGSSILALSSQSSGFLASGSGMVLGGRKSQSSSRLPVCACSLSIFTT